ncbi:MAG TPA: hypothetical protein VGG48_01750 [Rhizomicrobium sp.]|jgi:hypothetical protein
MTWKIWVEKQPWRMYRERLHLAFTGGQFKEKFFYAKPLQLVEVTESFKDVPEQNCLIEDAGTPDGSIRQFLQAALDAAWDLGLRPQGFKDHTLETAALRSHLDDMRTIVGTKLEVPLLLKMPAKEANK